MGEREMRREGGRAGRREGRRDGWREGGREGGRERGRAEVREGGRGVRGYIKLVSGESRGAHRLLLVSREDEEEGSTYLTRYLA
jgi:hypothetical protein